MSKKLITLAKELDFTTETEYFDYLIESYINGQFTQCRNLFNAMKKEDKKEFIKYVDNSYTEKDIKDFYFNLL